MMQELEYIYKKLCAEPTLYPTYTVNGLFSTLVRIACLPSGALPHIPTDVQKKFQVLSSRGESALEQYWTDRIVRADNPKEELEKFPYIEHYRALVRAEVGFRTSARTAIVCGSGPFPLTQVLLVLEHGFVRADGIEKDAKATQTARKLLHALGIQASAHIHQETCEESVRYGEYDLILVGACAENKRMIFSAISSRTEAESLIIARSADGNVRLLYQEVTLDMLPPEVEAQSIPRGVDYMNSHIIFSLPRKGPDLTQYR